MLPRAQSAQENCTIHNYNVIPNRKRDLLAVGAYQAGTYVVDFTDPARPKTVGWYDPPPLDPGALTLGGSWGSYWYNGFVYSSDITKGVEVNIPSVTGRTVSDARRILESAGFSVDVGDSTDSNVRRGLVAGTSPSGKAPKGSLITIHPSNGPGSSSRGGGGGGGTPWPQPTFTIVPPPDDGGNGGPGKPPKPPKPD